MNPEWTSLIHTCRGTLHGGIISWGEGGLLMHGSYLWLNMCRKKLVIVRLKERAYNIVCLAESSTFSLQMGTKVPYMRIARATFYCVSGVDI